MNKALIVTSALCIASLVLQILNGVLSHGESTSEYDVLIWIAVGLQGFGFVLPAMARDTACGKGGKFAHILFTVLTLGLLSFISGMAFQAKETHQVYSFVSLGLYGFACIVGHSIQY